MVRVGMWNLGNISGKGGEVCEELSDEGMSDLCCLQMRWRGLGARMLVMKGRRCRL